jgi:PmbA protein
LGARKLHSRKAPIIYHAEIARHIVGLFLNAISGNLLYRKATFLCDSLGKKVFPSAINLYEQPFLPKGFGSMAFDREGVATREQHFVKNGVVVNYVLNSYSARQLKMKTTGNAGGLHNAFMTLGKGKKTFQELLREMDTGLMVT